MNVDELRLLSSLLDEGIALPAAERESWLGALDGEAAKLADTLRELLAKHASQDTDALIHRAHVAAAPGPGAGDAVGPYHLLQELGHGGMGAVWLAERTDGHAKRKVALKLPHLGWAPGLAERFARESQILAGLEHPHIARLYDAGLDEWGRPYMAMEYVEGENLDAYCRARSLPVKARLELLLQVADAVAFAHSRLVVHRDLKPSNVLVTARGQVRLLDFGVAKFMEGDRAAETQLTRLSGRALTLDYASPEQIAGEPVGTSSDVYSLGVVCYEVLTGARPYRLKRGTAAELEEAIAVVDAPLASSSALVAESRRALRGDLDAILNKALKKRPADRYPSVEALAADLRRHLCDEPVSARPDAPGYVFAKLIRRYRVQAAGALLVAIAILAGAAAALWQAHRAETEARTARAVEAFLLDIFRSNSREQPDPAAARNRTAQQLLDAGAARAEADLADSPEARVRVLATLAQMYGELTLYERGLEMQRRRVAALREIHRGDHRETAVALGELGRFEAMAGQAAGAGASLAALAESLAMFDRLGDRDSLERGVVENARAITLADGATDRRSTSDALEAARHAVAILRAHPATTVHAQALLVLSSLLRKSGGNAAEMDATLQEALGVAEQLGDAGEAVLPGILNEKALQQAQGGQYGEAEKTLRRALAIRLARDGADSVLSLYQAYSLANLLLEGGEFLKALAELDAAAPAAEKRLAAGTRHWVPFATIAYRAWARAEAGQLHAGIAGLQEALQRQELLGEYPGMHVRLLVEAAAALRQARDFRGASALLDLADPLVGDGRAAKYRRLPQRERVRLSIARNDHVALRSALPQLAAAGAGTGAISRESLTDHNLAAEATLALDDAPKALEMAQQAIGLLDAGARRVGWKELELQAARTAGMAQLALGKAREARDLLQRAIDAGTGRLDPQSSPRMAELLELKARAEALLGDRAEADMLLARARSIRAARS